MLRLALFFVSASLLAIGCSSSNDDAAAAPDTAGDASAGSAPTSSSSSGGVTPAGAADSGMPCAVDAKDHRLYCTNDAKAPILDSAHKTGAPVDALETTYSWFDCWVTGDANAKGNDIWYHTVGDDHGAAGYVSADHVRTDSAYDTGPKTGLDKCTTGTAPEIAAQLLALWGGRVTGNSVAKQDLVTTSQGGSLNNSDTCGKTIKIDAGLLAALLKLTDTYDIFIDNIVTGHGCDQYFHPKGLASDLGLATERSTGKETNFTPGTARDNEALDKSFVEFFSTILPNNAGLGQSECAGRTTAKVRAGVHYFNDTCTHQHVQMTY